MPSALRSSILRADPDGRLGPQSVPRGAIFPFEHRKIDTTSRPDAVFGRSLDSARHRVQSSPASQNDLGATFEIGDVGPLLTGLVQS